MLSFPAMSSEHGWTVLQELDKILACKIFGYKTVGELYDDSNGVVWIPRIHTPCLLVSADDDPFLDPA